MSQVAVEGPVRLQALEVLFEMPGRAEFGLPGELAELYGGPLGFPEPRMYANFVASLDGVVAIPGEIDSSHAIAAGSKSDRFVMGLLRACADAVLIGAGTQRLSLVEGTEFLPSSPVGCRLLTLRQAGSHLFLRDELPPPGQVGA